MYARISIRFIKALHRYLNKNRYLAPTILLCGLRRPIIPIYLCSLLFTICLCSLCCTIYYVVCAQVCVLYRPFYKRLISQQKHLRDSRPTFRRDLPCGLLSRVVSRLERLVFHFCHPFREKEKWLSRNIFHKTRQPNLS